MKGIRERGQSLVEVVIGVAILSLVMTSATTVAVKSSKAGTDSYDRLRASQLVQEGLEAMRAYRDEWIRTHPLTDPVAQATAWNGAFPTNGGTPFRVATDSGGNWTFDTAAGSEAIGKYTRRIWVTNLGWSGGDATTDIQDGRRKRVTVGVSWIDQEGVSQSVSADTVLVDYQGINPSLATNNVKPPPPPPDDTLTLNFTVQTAPTLKRPRIRVYGWSADSTPLNGGNPIYDRVFGVGSASCDSYGYDPPETCEVYNEVVHLSPFGVTNAKTLFGAGQIRFDFLNDDCANGCAQDNNVIVNSILLSGQSADPALAYYSGSTVRPLSYPLNMLWDGSAYYLNGPYKPLVSLTSSAGSTTIPWNSATTLFWSTTYATSCSASGGWSGGITPVSGGSRSTGNLTATTDFTLNCEGTGGSTARTVTVSVGTQPPPALNFTADAYSVPYNGGTTLRWSSTDSTWCWGWGGMWGGGQWVALSGSQGTGGLTGSTTYNMECGQGELKVYRSVVVNIDPPTLTISATPNPVIYSGSASLSWTSANATWCWGWGASWGGGDWKPTSSGGTSTGSLTSDSTYNLQCGGPGGSITKGILIQVNPRPAITSFYASPSGLSYGQGTTLFWTSTNAENGCWSADFGWVAANGNLARANQTATYTYSLSCQNSAGAWSDPAYTTVTVGARPTASLSASPTSVAYGQSTTLTWSSTNATSCYSPEFGAGLATSGSSSSTPTSNYTYSLYCSNGFASSDWAYAAVTVAAAPTLTITADANPVPFGGTTTIHLRSTNTTYCESAQWGAVPTSYDRAGVGVGTYSFRCNNGYAWTNNGNWTSYTVTASNPPSLTISADTNPVAYGQSTWLRLRSSNTVYCESSTWGSVPVNWDVWTGAGTYSFRCHNGFVWTNGGNWTDYTISSNPAPAIQVWADSSNVCYGCGTTVHLRSQNTTYCESTNWGSVPINWDVGVGAGSYGFRCHNGFVWTNGGNWTWVTVTQDNPPPPPPPNCQATAGGFESGGQIYITGGGSGCQYYHDSIVGWNGGGTWGPVSPPGYHCQKGGIDPWGWLSEDCWPD